MVYILVYLCAYRQGVHVFRKLNENLVVIAHLVTTISAQIDS
jgi:hypothetical protein